MKNLLIFISLILSLVACKTQEKKDIVENNDFELSGDSLDGVYIPKDLGDCFSQIDNFWNDSIKDQARALTENEFSGQAHFGFGIWMRNNWGLWKGSRLAKYFNDLGVRHPDDMSGIVLQSYHRYLMGKDIELEEQTKFYRDYWDKAKEEDEQKKK